MPETESEQTETESVKDSESVENESAEQAKSDEDEGKSEDWRSNFDADKAAERIRKLQSENKNLRSRAKAAEDKSAGADESAERLQALEAENLRMKVGMQAGLPQQLVDRLRGSNEEEMLADAQALLELVAPKPTGSKPVESLRGGGKPEQEERVDFSKLAERIASRHSI